MMERAPPGSKFGNRGDEMDKENGLVAHAGHRSRGNQRGKTWTIRTVYAQNWEFVARIIAFRPSPAGMIAQAQQQAIPKQLLAKLPPVALQPGRV